jgi:hypothetical protein
MRQIACGGLIVALQCAPAAHAGAPAPVAPRLKSSIPPQTVPTAIAAFENQTGLQVVFLSDVVGQRPSRGAGAGLTPECALWQLLADTGLRFQFLNRRTVEIEAAPAGEGAGAGEDAEPQACRPAETPGAGLGEVIVTATRREEWADRVPTDLYVWTAPLIDAAGVKGMTEIGALTPGVEFDFFSSVGSGVYTNMAIRGVTDRHGSATGVFIDDIPIPPVRSNTLGPALPAAFDLDRIEVLRGPQGTLMGEYTQGGAIRFVPNQPSLTSVSGSGHAEWAITARGEPTFEAGAAAGGPLIENVLGIRASGWYRTDGGYIDRVDPITGVRLDADSDRSMNKSARLALAFAPTPELRIAPTVDYESTRARDSSAFFTYLSDPAAGRLRNGSLIAQPFDDTFSLATLRLTAGLGAASLDSVSAYFNRTGHLDVDDTESAKWGGWGNPLGAEYPESHSNAITTTIGLTQRWFSQELRLSSPDPDSRSSWVAAVSYSGARYLERDHVSGAFVPVLDGPLDSADTTTTVQDQWAAFGELARALGPRLMLRAGVRVEREDYDAVSIAPPAFHAHAVETLMVPKLTLSYEAGDQSHFYVSAAEGYAPAGVDAALPTCFEQPQVYPTDTLWSFELGAKSSLLDGRAHVDASVFHVRWDNGPVSTGNCLFTHLAGRAVSDGFDVASQARFLSDRMTAGVSLSYTNAHYTQTIMEGGQVVVRSGESVGTPPLVTSPWNLTGWIERRVGLRDGATIELRAQDVLHTANPGPFYTSERGSPYYAPGLAADPATNVLSLKAGLELRPGTFEHGFEVAFYLNNVLDSQPTLLKRNKGNDVGTLFYATTLRPRTLGLEGTWRF